MRSINPKGPEMRILFHTLMTVVTGGTWLVALLFWKYVIQHDSK